MENGSNMGMLLSRKRRRRCGGLAPEWWAGWARGRGGASDLAGIGGVRPQVDAMEAGSAREHRGLSRTRFGVFQPNDCDSGK